MDHDLAAYKLALSAYPTGVCVVTAQHGAAARGITVNSFTSISLRPKLVGWSIDLTARAFGVFSSASHYAVHILSADDRAWADRFASSDEQDVPVAVQDVPLLDIGLTRLVCLVQQRLTIGDHLLLVGAVDSFTTQGGAALSYYRSHYGVMEA